MKKVGNIFSEILFDKKIEEIAEYHTQNKLEEENKENTLKTKYSIDIRITRGGGEDSDKKDVTSYIQNVKGEAAVPENTVANIQNLHNLIDYMSGLYENGKPLLSDLVSEIIKTAADNGADSLQDLVQEDDKIIVDIDYGFEEQDAAGVKINKSSGSDLVAFSMKKDGNIIPGKFTMDIFEQQVLALRRRFMEKE